MVIDDTDDDTQLKNLLPLPLYEPLQLKLHPHSLIIITSRRKTVLNARCTHVSEVRLLPKGLDEQLLEAWAFARGRPNWDTSMLVPRVVACCGRLPLTLKVSVSLV